MSDDNSEDEWLVERVGPGPLAELPRRELIARCRRRAAAVRAKAESVTDPMVRAQLSRHCPPIRSAGHEHRATTTAARRITADRRAPNRLLGLFSFKETLKNSVLPILEHEKSTA